MTDKINELMALALELRSVSNEQALGKALALRAVLEDALKPTQEPIGYVHPEALKRIQNGETVAFRKKPYVGEATLAVFLAPAQADHVGGVNKMVPPRREPLSDAQAKRMAKVGPVYAPDGRVELRPDEYRREIEGARLAGIRLAEEAHGITGEKT